jgi:hypothetical protein
MIEMKPDDKEALLDFISGSRFVFGFVVFVSVLAFIANASANWLDAQPTPQNQRFEVVDEYKGCDVIQYNPDGSARYSYFLHCK